VLSRTGFPNGVTALVSTLFERDGFLAAFTERGGGVSGPPFATLNLGLRTGDDRTSVIENRGRVASALGVDRFASARQVHGATLARLGADLAGAGFADAEEALDGADALVTMDRNVALAVLAADCVPVALADPRRGALAVVHAGWRGVAGGIVGTSLRSFEHPSEILAAVGPAIGVDHFEVGEDVVAVVASGTDGRAVVRRSGSRIYLDLPGTVERILRESGVAGVDRADDCTACEPDRFFSYRRDGRTGRQALIAVRRG
jgi:purine-nucleoside/S-methyl-5'-thioadenosine phosphorylase / adenosine deaminase